MEKCIETDKVAVLSYGEWIGKRSHNEAVDCVSGIDRNIWCGFKEWSGNLCGWSKTESNMDRQ